MSSSFPHLTYLVPAQHNGVPLVELAYNLAGERGRLAAERGGAWLDNRRLTDPQHILNAHTTLVLRFPPEQGYDHVELNANHLAFEDEWLLVLHKPAGWYVNAVPWDTYGTIVAALHRFLSVRDGVAPPLHLAHRLDRDTTGLLLLSKHPAANGPLQAAFSQQQVYKRYRCHCAGLPPWQAYELRTGHGRSAHGRWRIYPLEEVGHQLPQCGGRVRLAHTSFSVKAQFTQSALVCAYPHTGRTHQIRLHMASLGLPLLGDTRYGGPDHYQGQPLSGHLLHAAELSLKHPITGATLTLTSPLPPRVGWLQRNT
ncbi:RluA family pseudouridine synthase [Candidatus Viridilinea mediisalina]|uniref:RluA family pseudouridine synthase n=1 Tax=Candidatus Viridilinea mediisalina TaxID=2024553 RepID=UPI001FE4A084|nr:RluA family pseudouridine synthase [Candidatus Viridilinea mediisalina]